MIIRDMFAKPIDRDIKGVIKVGQGDDSNIRQELEEYVVTRELQKHFRGFFESYKNGITGNTDKMGVWISGFFGSGKSHFLKILSYVLENKVVDGKSAIDYFVDDDKIADPMVLADMKLAASVPTDAILFNIDSKSESNGKENNDAIVSVFLKVFNKMQGFCSSNFALADLERRLFGEGKYDEFRSTFENSYGQPWEEARDEFDFIQDDVIDALVDIGYMSAESARSWSDKALEPYSISIEDFAKLVKKYIDSKGKNHHVVFLVDEVGQYIGDNSKLMLNLQTVTEELGIACRGKAWVVVTSQQDIDSITKIKGNDFSKIQGRFDGKVQLMLAHPASAGHGLNLQAGGNIIVWFGLTWSLELYQQFNARLYRQGQKQGVIIHHLCMAQTHDEDVILALRNKDRVQMSLMNSIKAKIDNYLKNI